MLAIATNIVIHGNVIRAIPAKLVLETHGGRVRWTRKCQGIYLGPNEFRTREEARRGRPNRRGKGGHHAA